MNTLSFLFKRDPIKLLGRWNVDYCQQILHTKVKLANEDNCGTCHMSTTSGLVKHASRAVKMSKAEKDATRRYNEYINIAIRNRKTNVQTNSTNDINKQIEHYICMN
jgi:hypothetical protein